MYTILLVDDEDEARKSIKELTPWNEYGFEVIGEASNGLEALDFVSETLPDVIITDIRMPYLDGIGFIEEVRARYSPSVDVIILSGYDEFTFAQTAMRLNVAEYVLKPVSVSSMKEVLRRARERLDQDRAKVSDKERMETFYKDAVEVYRERFLATLIAPARRQESQIIKEKAAEYGVPLSGRLFAAAIIDIPADMQAAVASITAEAMKDDSSTIPFLYENQEVIIFTSGMESSFSPLFSKQIYRTLSLLQSRFLHYFPQAFNIGIGEMVTDILNLPVSYRSAVEALNYSQLYPDQHIISINDVETVESDRSGDTGDRKTELVMAIKFGNSSDTETAVHSFFEGIMDTPNVQNAAITVLSIISEICASYGRNAATLLDGEDLRVRGASPERFLAVVRPRNHLAAEHDHRAHGHFVGGLSPFCLRERKPHIIFLALFLHIFSVFLRSAFKSAANTPSLRRAISSACSLSTGWESSSAPVSSVSAGIFSFSTHQSLSPPALP